MKARRPPLVLLPLLVGCGQVAQEPAPAEDNRVVSAGNETVAPQEEETGSDNRQAGAAADKEGGAGTIPADFHGVYDRDSEACATVGSEYRLRVSGDALRFHESIGDVRAVRSDGDDAILVDADFEGEGESWSNRLRLSRGADGALTVAQPDGSRVTRTRCS